MDSLTLGQRVFRSEDSGATWEELGLYLSVCPTDIACDPQDADHIWVAIPASGG